MSEYKNGDAVNTSIETVLTHAGRYPEEQFGFVNTPVYRGSTVLFKTLADLDAQQQRYLYGRAGNPTTDGVEEIITALEGAHRTKLVPSGLAAITIALMACVKTGDDLLITDSAYEPTRAFAEGFLRPMGVSVRYYDPCIGAGIADLMQPNTKAIMAESPGSLTFEVQDLRALAEVAHRNGARLVVDNSWATPLYLRPIALGADIVIHAATKMFVGHSDVLAGTVSATEAAWPDVARVRQVLGFFSSGDDAYLVARGLRTLALRMAAHQERALAIASWLEGQDEVLRVLHPALPSHPNHDLWKRDFTGSGSLFGMVLKSAPRPALAAFVDGLQVFAMGYSWGGYESLCIPSKIGTARSVVPFGEDGHLMRLHIGHEGLDDLKADLSAALARYSAAR